MWRAGANLTVDGLGLVRPTDAGVLHRDLVRVFQALGRLRGECGGAFTYGGQRIPDFVKLAEAYGCLAIRVTKEEEIEPAITLALETNDRPVVIDFIVSRDAMVWPMVPQGVGNSSVQYARDHAPEWEEE